MFRRLSMLGFFALPWLLGSCSENGYCARFPGRCQIENLELEPKTLDLETINPQTVLRLTSSTMWSSLPSGLHGQLKPQSGESIRLAELVPRNDQSADIPQVDAQRGRLSAGVYTLRIYQDDREVPQIQQPPSLTIAEQPVQLTWKTSPVKREVSLPNPSVSPPSNPSVRGVWTDGDQQFLLLRDYVQAGDQTPTSLISVTDSAPRFFGMNSPAVCFFDVWRFVDTMSGALPRAVWFKTASPSGYSILDGAVSGSSGVLHGKPQDLTTASAVAMLGSKIGLLTQTDKGLKGYVWDRDTAVLASMAPVVTLGLPTPAPTLTVMAGYADKSNGTGTIGVLGLDAAGRAYFFSFDGTNFQYNDTTSQAISNKTLGTITSVAVGELNGDDLNDLAVGRSGTIDFYVQRVGGGFVSAKSPLRLEMGVVEAALAIGPYYGQAKKQDLLVADKAQQGTGSSISHQVYVYQNSSQ